MHTFLLLNLHIWEEVQAPNLGASTFIPPTATQNVTSLEPAPGKVSQRYKGKKPSFTARQARLHWWAQPRSLLKRASQVYFVQVSSQSQAYQGEETFCSLSVASPVMQGANPAMKYASLYQPFKSGFFFSQSSHKTTLDGWDFWPYSPKWRSHFSLCISRLHFRMHVAHTGNVTRCREFAAFYLGWSHK